MQLPSTVILQTFRVTCLIFQQAYIAYCYVVSSRVNRQLVRETSDEKKTQAFQMIHFQDVGTLCRAHRTRPSYNVCREIKRDMLSFLVKARCQGTSLSSAKEIAHELLPSDGSALEIFFCCCFCCSYHLVPSRIFVSLVFISRLSCSILI